MSGLFGVISNKDCVLDAFYGTDYQSHMGTAKAGLAVLGNSFQREIHNLSRQGEFKSGFNHVLKEWKGNKGVGVISDKDPQPLLIHSKLGDFAIVFDGLISNLEQLVKEFPKQPFEVGSQGEINATEVIAKLICQRTDYVSGILNVFDRIQGSASILLLTQEGIYAARDSLGRTSLVIGEKSGTFAIASESCGFANLGLSIKHYIGPGEIVLLTPRGIIQKKPAREIKQICAFLWVYTGSPGSSYEGISVELVRERCGRALARRDDIQADFVAGVPDSGTGHSVGYAMEAGTPWRRPFIKYSTAYGRSYTPLTQEERDLIAAMKLCPVKDVIEGNRIVLCEDSIVRGTQLRNQTIRQLWENGAKEIHLRAACPPLMFPCKFLLSTREKNELAARRAIKSLEEDNIENVSEYLNADSGKYAQMIEWIRQDLNVTTLKYQRLEDMVQAIGLPFEELCLYCWIGNNQIPDGSKMPNLF